MDEQKFGTRHSQLSISHFHDSNSSRNARSASGRRARTLLCRRVQSIWRRITGRFGDGRGWTGLAGNGKTGTPTESCCAQLSKCVWSQSMCRTIAGTLSDGCLRKIMDRRNNGMRKPLKLKMDEAFRPSGRIHRAENTSTASRWKVRVGSLYN
jgi:hypothetical protein